MKVSKNEPKEEHKETSKIKPKTNVIEKAGKKQERKKEEYSS